MADWNSEQYLKFREQRTQPARDLAMRIQHSAPKSAIDIGCGPGNSTSILKEIFPGADLLGIDSSANMIDRAKAEHPDIAFRVCDARSLSGSYDLLFSNACLQWIPDHASLIPFLMEHLCEHGALAVQIPMNSEEPLFRLFGEIAQQAGMGAAGRPTPAKRNSYAARVFQYFVKMLFLLRYLGNKILSPASGSQSIGRMGKRHEDPPLSGASQQSQRSSI